MLTLMACTIRQLWYWFFLPAEVMYAIGVVKAAMVIYIIIN